MPRIDARERTVAKSCHYQSPENAFRAYPAIAGRLGMHSVDSCHRQTSENAQLRHTATVSRPVAQRSPREGVDIPSSRGLTAGNDFESALFRWATMSPLRVLQSCAVLCAEAKSALTFM